MRERKALERLPFLTEVLGRVPKGQAKRRRAARGGVGPASSPRRHKTCKMALRWGVVSAGFIASDFTTVLSSLPPTEHQVHAPWKTLGRGSKEETLVLGTRESLV